MANILGISIGTTNVGLAIIRQRKLTDYRIRTFPGKWTPIKCSSILDVVDTLIVTNGITDITVKIPPPTHCSANIQELLRGLDALAAAYHIEVLSCTFPDIVKLFTDQKKAKRQLMMAALIQRYPRLEKHFSGSKGSRRYKTKLFEAIASAELALRAGH